MFLRHWLCLLTLISLGTSQGGEAFGFTPPQAYPVERYEAGWYKNPFTLKTVTPVAVQGSFATDLAIGAHYGAADNPTVVIVNTKTNERILLRKDKPASNGMSLKSVHLAINRSECRAEVLLGAEAALLTYDASYLSQMAANEASRMATAKPSGATGPAKRPATAPSIPLPIVTPSAAPLPKTSQVVQPVTAAMAATASAPARNRFAAPALPHTKSQP